MSSHPTSNSAAVGQRFPGLNVVSEQANPTVAAMLEHRSCRQFSGEPLDDDLLQLVLAAAFSSPSKSDFQQCSVIVVDDPGRRQAIVDLIPSMPWLAEASRFLLFCADNRRLRQLTAGHGVAFANDHLDSVLNASTDAAIHLSSFIWAAEAVGLGTCPISVVRNHIAEVSDIVELPDHVFPVAGLCVGWPTRLRPLSPRLPLDVTVHRNRYDDSEARDLIAEYDSHRGPLGSDQGLWSEEKARMSGRTERDQLAAHLATKGFGLG